MLIISTFAKAQMPIGGGYEPDAKIDKFVGTWQWVSLQDTLTIILHKQQIYLTSVNCSYDMLVGWHKYVKNGIVIEDDLQNVGIQWTTQNSTRFSSLLGFSQGDYKVYFTTLKDFTYNKIEDLRLKMLLNSLTQAEWQINDGRGIYCGPPNTYGKFSMPQNLILVKQ